MSFSVPWGSLIASLVMIFLFLEVGKTDQIPVSLFDTKINTIVPHLPHYSVAFKTISVSGQSNVVADSATDTLNVSGTGLVSVTTTAGTDTIDIGTASAAQISFTKADGTSSDIDLQTSGKINEVLTNLHIPFTKADGTSVTTLVVS